MKGAKQERVRTCCSPCASLLDAAVLDWAAPGEMQSESPPTSRGFAPASAAFLGILRLLLLLRLLRLVLLILLAVGALLLLPVFLALSLGFILALTSTSTLSRDGRFH